MKTALQQLTCFGDYEDSVLFKAFINVIANRPYNQTRDKFNLMFRGVRKDQILDHLHEELRELIVEQI